MTDTPAAPATLPEAIRAMVIEAVPDWIARGGNELALREWEGVLSHPTTSPALKELAENGRKFVEFFLDVLTAVGLEGSIPELTCWSQGEDLTERPDDPLAVFRKMAAMLFDKFG